MKTHTLELLEFSPDPRPPVTPHAPLSVPNELPFQWAVIDAFLARTDLLSVGRRPVAKANR